MVPIGDESLVRYPNVRHRAPVLIANRRQPPQFTRNTFGRSIPNPTEETGAPSSAVKTPIWTPFLRGQVVLKIRVIKVFRYLRDQTINRSKSPLFLVWSTWKFSEDLHPGRCAKPLNSRAYRGQISTADDRAARWHV